MTQPSLRARLSYAFDNSLSRGPVALIGWLGLASVAVVVGVSLLVWASTEQDCIIVLAEA